jgi:hypothetical protein
MLASCPGHFIPTGRVPATEIKYSIGYRTSLSTGETREMFVIARNQIPTPRAFSPYPNYMYYTECNNREKKGRRKIGKRKLKKGEQ